MVLRNIIFPPCLFCLLAIPSGLAINALSDNRNDVLDHYLDHPVSPDTVKDRDICMGIVPMTDWIDKALEKLEKQDRIVRISVCHTRGSAPRHTDARLLLDKSDIWGTIGGGNLELQALARAKKLLNSGEPRILFETVRLADAASQSCGGEVTLLYEAFCKADRDWLERLRQSDGNSGDNKVFYRMIPLQSDQSSRLVERSSKLVESAYGRHNNRPGQSMRLLDRAGALLDLPDPGACHTVIEEIRRTPHNLVVFGAGHVGRAVVPIVATLGYPIYWIDERASIFPSPVPEQVKTVNKAPFECLDLVNDHSHVLVFTHAHELDYQIVSKLLQNGHFASLGMIGSLVKKRRFLKRLETEAGMSKAAIDQLICPIGMPEIGGNKPEHIAISVAADLITRLHRP